ncbi:hypothetical protein [Metabacillus idriensis]|uniref:hypothetical protein n=1 Tax=Metabacillus idriensis TaxID=324768 RepID=UPI003D2A1FFD
MKALFAFTGGAVLAEELGVGIHGVSKLIGGVLQLIHGVSKLIGGVLQLIHGVSILIGGVPDKLDNFVLAEG